ncbi:MAG: ATP-binding cassette domain-containing protein [Bacilli bacterium]|nr:ATP-binding cassette domain-containing protein [Bacilli bacterium]
MPILSLSNVSKIYKIDKETSFYALKDFSYSFPHQGLVSICGKSGSGKSTLLSIISLMDKPSEGYYTFNDEKTNKWKKERINYFRNQEIGIIFQHYNLLDDESALYNICFPLLVKGESTSRAKKKTYSIAKRLKIDPLLLKKKVADLSGGERQRIAILRSIINDPLLLLADEPTGALDYKNSIIIMDLLKEISKEHLVIMVSHNYELVNSYSDEIIYLKDGAIESIDVRNETISKRETKHRKKRMIKKNAWPIISAMKITIKKLNKSVISILSLLFGLIASNIIIGFSYGSKDAAIKSSYQQIDYGVLNISHQEKSHTIGGKITLIKEERPSEKEINKLINEEKNILFFPNISYFFPLDTSISCGDTIIENMTYSPLYSFDEEHLNSSLLLSGRFPNDNNETIINKSAYELFRKKKIDPLNLILEINIVKELTYMSGDAERPIISDYFVFKKEISVVGVVDDFAFLSTPKLFYSYLDNIEVLDNYLFENLSYYLNEEITMFDYLLSSQDTAEISSYSYTGFYLDYEKYEEIEKICMARDDKISITSLGLERSKACLELINACSMGMDIFLIISLMGTILIIGIVSFSSFSEDKRKIAIMFSLGASRDSVLSTYLYSNLFLGFSSFFLSIIISSLLEGVFNHLLFKIVGIKNLIKIPFSSLFGWNYLFPIITLLVIIITIFISSYFPILFASKISLKEELKEE